MGLFENDYDTVRQVVLETICGPAFRRATFGGTARKSGPSPWARVAIRPIELRGERHLQFSYFDSHKDTTKNYRPDEAQTCLEELIAIGFAGIHLSTLTEEIDIRTTKKGVVSIARSEATATSARDEKSQLIEDHNRTKNVPLPEGRANRLLEVMGILTSNGRVRPTMRSKFTQINEFLKHLLHVFEAGNFQSLDREVEILDCGCGLSYLSLAVYHYLNDVLAIPSHITGVDVNDEVIRKSVTRAERLSMDKLAFSCGRIRDVAVKPDIVIALHACDTATDDAIARAITSEAKLLLSVPCCHKNLNRAIYPEGESEMLRPLLRHGILRQRTADLVTDAFRAQALKIMGYRTDVVEFVGTEHTARNLMIRAVRGTAIGEASDLKEYKALRQFWNVTPYIEKLLGEPFQRLLV